MDKLSKTEIIEILSQNSKGTKLFSKANDIREKSVGNKVHLRGLIEFSNICKRDCKYCGIRCENKTVKRYRMSKDKIIETVENAVKIGYKTIVLQSGEDDFYSADKMCEIISKIKRFDVALTLSIGEKTFEEYKAYKKAGADRYLLRIETTDKIIYKNMHPNSDYENRIRCLSDLKTLGYEVGTGCLVGLPNQTVESLAEDIMFFKEIDADMIGIGPFIPHPQTPLKNSPNGDFYKALKVMAITRIMMPKINMPATTAMETLIPNGRLIALQSGANVIMPNVTPFEYREQYEIYPKKFAHKSVQKERNDLEQYLYSIGRPVSKDYGFRTK